MASPFGKATFVEDQDGEGRLVGWLLLEEQRCAQAGRDQGAQVVTHRVLVPNGCREQALDAIRARLPGLLSDLPAIFARNVAQHGLQVAQGVLMGFWAGEVGTEPCMQLTQVFVPPADLWERGPHLYRCGMLRVLHAVLAFDEGRREKGCNF